MFKTSRGYGSSDNTKSADPYKSSKSLSRRSLSNNQDTENSLGLGLNDLNLNTVNDQQMTIMSNIDGLNGEQVDAQVEGLERFGRKSGSERMIANCRFTGSDGINVHEGTNRLGGNGGVRRLSKPNGPGGIRKFNSGSELEGSGRTNDGHGRRGGPQFGGLGELGVPGRFGVNGGAGEMGGNGGINRNGGIGGGGRISGFNGLNGIGRINGGLRESGEVNGVGGISGPGEEFQFTQFNGPNEMIWNVEGKPIYSSICKLHMFRNYTNINQNDLKMKKMYS